MAVDQVLLIYDKECPACDNYCQWVRIKQTVGQLQLVDARQGGAVIDEITARGWDIDQGMVLKLDQQWYYAEDAIHMLALIGSRSGFFNRFNYWLFRSRRLSGILYPVLKFFRNLLLKMLGVRKINNLHLDNNDRF